MVSLLLNGYGTAVFGLLALAPQLSAFGIILVTALYMLAMLLVLGIIFRIKRPPAALPADKKGLS